MGFLVPVFIVLVLLVLFFWTIIKTKNNDSDASFFSMIVVAIALFVFGFLWFSSYTWSIEAIADMNAFEKATRDSYEYAIDATENVEIKGITAMTGEIFGEKVMDVDVKGLAYEGQGQATAERIKEFRDKVEEYNTCLEALKAYNRLWYLDGFVADAPEDLALIKLSGE